MEEHAISDFRSTISKSNRGVEARSKIHRHINNEAEHTDQIAEMMGA
jgi:hypothetical protein